MGLIPIEELKVEIVQPHPPGGQHVGTYSGVKVTHIPSGIIAIVDSDRSQHRNRAIAFDMIEAALTSPNYR